jgi:hypothetical protein
VPVPLSESVCGLAVLLSYNWKVADSFATREGMKVTVIAHGAAGASDPPQGGSPALLAKSVPLGPVKVAAVRVAVMGPTLAMVTVAETGVPTATIPKFTGVGLNLIKVPIPAKATRQFLDILAESESNPQQKEH